MILSRSSLRQQYRNGLFRLGLRELRKKHYESPSVEVTELNQHQALMDSNPDVPGGMKAPDNYELDDRSSAFCLLCQISCEHCDIPIRLCISIRYQPISAGMSLFDRSPSFHIRISFCLFALNLTLLG